MAGANDLGISLTEAVLEFGDLDAAARMRHRLGRVYLCDYPLSLSSEERLAHCKRQANAEACILAKLRTGELIARGLRVGASPVEGCIEINPDQWRVLKPDFEHSSAKGGGNSIEGITVATAANIVTEESVAPASPAGKNKGGRPAAFNWLLFDKEMISIANGPDGLPERPELNKRMHDFCVRVWGDKVPGESTLRDRISMLMT